MKNKSFDTVIMKLDDIRTEMKQEFEEVHKELRTISRRLEALIDKLNMTPKVESSETK